MYACFDGKKWIEGLSGKEIKQLASNGTIKRDTIIRFPSGQEATADKISGVEFGPPSQSITNTQVSIADEIKKMKTLLDEKVITQEEFDAFKKKCLGCDNKSVPLPEIVQKNDEQKKPTNPFSVLLGMISWGLLTIIWFAFVVVCLHSKQDMDTILPLAAVMAFLSMVIVVVRCVFERLLRKSNT